MENSCPESSEHSLLPVSFSKQLSHYREVPSHRRFALKGMCQQRQSLARPPREASSGIHLTLIITIMLDLVLLAMVPMFNSRLLNPVVVDTFRVAPQCSSPPEQMESYICFEMAKASCSGIPILFMLS